jgi:hypothetical protein
LPFFHPPQKVAISPTQISISHAGYLNIFLLAFQFYEKMTQYWEKIKPRGILRIFDIDWSKQGKIELSIDIQ